LRNGRYTAYIPQSNIVVKNVKPKKTRGKLELVKVNQMLKPRIILTIQSLFGAVVLLCLATTNSTALTKLETAALTFTHPPASGVVLPELDEFATTVIGDPWDMKEPTDLWAYRSESQMINSSFSNGIYSAQMTTGLGGERITLLSAGAPNHTAMRVGKTGYAYPINADHYRYLTYRFYKSNNECNSALLIWFADDTYTSAVQGVSNSYAACETSQAGWHTKVVDLKNIGIQQGSKNWSGTIRELLIKPFAGPGAANATVKLDWARLTNADPRTARPYTIRWTGGSGTVTLYASPDNKTLDSNDILIAQGINGGSGSYTFQTGTLPAGKYYLAASTDSGVVWSSGSLIVNAPPKITITKPSMTSGQDFAATEAGNAWDMNDSSDMNDALPLNWETCVSNESFSGGIYSATMTGCSTDTIFTDARLIIGNMNPPGIDPIVDTNKYRYFSFRYFLSGEESVGEGWVSRLGWWQTINGITTEPAVMGRDIMLLEGWNTYTIDLWASDAVDEAHPVQVPWTSSSPNRLRFDPAELYLSRLPANYQLDWIKLTAMDEVSRGEVFSIEYDMVDDGSASVTYYYDTDTNPANGKNIALMTNSISAAGQSVDASQSAATTEASWRIYLPAILNNYCGDCLLWDTSSVALGDYYICIEANDSYNSTYQCSETPARVKSN
jgi:hypothetical protein